MVLEAPKEVGGKEYEVRILMTNKVDGLLKCKRYVIDGKTEFYYEISSKQPMSRVLAGVKLGYETLQAIFSGIGKVLGNAAEFLLEDNNFILEMEYIYMEVETKEVYLCYLPFYHGDISISFRNLAEQLLQQVNHEDEKAVLFGYSVYSQVTRENYLVWEVLKGAFRQMKSEMQTEMRTGVQTGIQAKTETQIQSEVQAPMKVQVKIPTRTSTKTQSEIQAPTKKQIVFPRFQRTADASLSRPEKKQQTIRGKAKKNKAPKNKGLVIRKPKRGLQPILGIIVAGTMLIGGFAALLFFQILNVTQVGGLLFLIIGLGFYLFSGNKKPLWTKEYKKESLVQDNLFEEIVEEDELAEAMRSQEIMRNLGSIGSQESMSSLGNINIGVQESMSSLGSIESQESIENQEVSATYGQTTILTASPIGMTPVLISISPEQRENIIVTKEDLLIGKMKNQVDIFLNLPTISRLHAKVERREEVSYLMDLNSTNGTFLNGERLQANERRKLVLGDEIFFAGAGYYFKG